MLTPTDSFGNDTVVMRQAGRMCERLLKPPADVTGRDGTVATLPNSTLTLGTDTDQEMRSLAGALGVLSRRESPTLPRPVLPSSMKGSSMVANSLFDVFAPKTRP